MKTADLSGEALDYAVAKCEGRTIRHDPMRVDPRGFWIWEETPSGLGGILIEKSIYMKIGSKYSPSTNWAQGGPIIERERMELHPAGNEYSSDIERFYQQYGKTPLIAAMRCYITSKLGEDVEIPSTLALSIAEQL